MSKDFLVEGKTPGEAVERLRQIIEYLRSEEGCPWDKVQTHDSLKVCMVEEAYEVNEAIENKDWNNLEEELGDVLLQVVFHGDLGKANGKFDLTSIANRECEKMIRRHPHVFSNFKVDTIDSALEKWENVKKKENPGTQTGSMQKIPKSLPALRRSYKIQAKAADVGFDWDHVSEAFHKVDEETRELLEAYQENDQGKIQEEIGDLLFAVVNVARFLQIDPEDALNFTSHKFIRRFSFIEDQARLEGSVLEDMSLAEMDKLWEEAKKLELQGLLRGVK